VCNLGRTHCHTSCSRRLRPLCTCDVAHHALPSGDAHERAGIRGHNGGNDLPGIAHTQDGWVQARTAGAAGAAGTACRGK